MGVRGRFSEAVNADFNQGKFGSYTSYQRLQADGWQLNALEAAYATDKETKRKYRNPEKTRQRIRKLRQPFYSNTVNQRFTYAVNDRLTLGIRVRIIIGRTTGRHRCINTIWSMKRILMAQELNI